MTSINYVKYNKKLHSIYYLDPPIEEISKCIRSMYDACLDQRGFLCKEEIIAKIAKDVADLGISEEHVRRLLFEEEPS